ncbi:MAG: ABC transporter permease [Firmicutes bacterium]|nr:ABC transporter permease [Bacillota bacterium]
MANSKQSEKNEGNCTPTKRDIAKQKVINIFLAVTMPLSIVLWGTYIALLVFNVITFLNWWNLLWLFIVGVLQYAIIMSLFASYTYETFKSLCEKCGNGVIKLISNSRYKKEFCSGDSGEGRESSGGYTVTVRGNVGSISKDCGTAPNFVYFTTQYIDKYKCPKCSHIHERVCKDKTEGRKIGFREMTSKEESMYRSGDIYINDKKDSTKD